MCARWLYCTCHDQFAINFRLTWESYRLQQPVLLAPDHTTCLLLSTGPQQAASADFAHLLLLHILVPIPARAAHCRAYTTCHSRCIGGHILPGPVTCIGTACCHKHLLSCAHCSVSCLVGSSQAISPAEQPAGTSVCPGETLTTQSSLDG